MEYGKLDIDAVKPYIRLGTADTWKKVQYQIHLYCIVFLKKVV